MWIIIALFSLAALLILALSLPLDMTFKADIYGRPKLRMRLSWLFGLLIKEIAGGKKEPEPKGKAGKKRWRISNIPQFFKLKGLVKQSYRLVQGIISQLKIRNLIVDLRIGLDNPADTGILFAIIGPALAFLNPRYPHQISIQPSFDDAVLEGYTLGKIRLQPIRLTIPLLKFVFSSAALRAVKVLAAGKWKRKK